MKALLSLMAVTVSLPFFNGCPRVTTVELVNHASSPVQVQVFYNDDQNTPKELLEATGHEVDFTIPAGGIETFSHDCNAFQAVIVHGDLHIVGDIGPSKTSDVFRDGSDFGCGDTITFTFTAPVLPTELNIEFDQRP
jgi:hypothetical protein